MAIHVVRAEIGQWYSQARGGELFRVVGVDERSRTIEIQMLEGDLDELDAETWGALQLTRCSAPEVWTDPTDDAEAYDRCDLTGRSLSRRDVLAVLHG